MRTPIRSKPAGVATLLIALLGLLFSASSALAAGQVGWKVSSLAEPSVFSAKDAVECESEEKCDRYQLLVQNVGAEASHGTIKLTDVLPAGVTLLRTETGFSLPEEHEWGCTGGPGNTVVCEIAEAVAGGHFAPWLEIAVTSPANEVPRTLTNVATVESEGAASASSTLETAANGPASRFSVSEFAFEPGTETGQPEPQAGAHPWELTTSLGVPSVAAPVGSRKSSQRDEFEPVKQVKTVSVELPLGFFGNPLAATNPKDECTEVQLHTESCPPESRVGTYAVAQGFFTQGMFASTESGIGGPPSCCSAVYNMKPDAGYPAQFGFTFATLPIELYASAVHTAAGERLRVTVPGVPEEASLFDSKLTLYGEPGQQNGTGGTGAFLTNPVDCSAKGLSARVELTAWSEPEHAVSRETTAYPGLTGCDVLQFNPQLSFEPSPPSESEPGTTQADTPSAYTAVVKVPQDEAFSSQATPELRTATVTLPAGVTLNPSAANGLAGCPAEGSEGINLGSSDIGQGGEDLGDPAATEFGAGHEGGNGSPYDDGFWHTAPGHCPAASTVGTAEVITPVLSAPLKGHVFVAQPQCGGEGQKECTEASATNGELFAAYLEVSGSGVIVKLKGTLAANPATGQITASFTENPQLPFTEVKLHIHGGPRAPFANPQTCGTATTSSSLEPWSETAPALVNSSFNVTGCPAGGMPFAPSFSAGTTSSQAAASSAFVLSFSRKDGEQDFSGLTETMPPGLIGRITGIPQCPEAQANAGTCGPESQVGVSSVLAGAGSQPLPVGGGRVYLTGPYNGAPFGLSIVVPTRAGPFNLGNEVIRARILINPTTAQVTVITNPLPQSKDGVQFRLKTVNTEINRPGFILNPTNCAPQSITGTLSAFQGATAAVSTPFQAQGCAALKFQPKFSANTAGAAHPNGPGASFHVRVLAKEGPGGGEANIKRVEVQLPKLLPARLTTLQKSCTQAQFSANPAGCPEFSFVGTATARTPVLSNALTGPAILVSHGGAAFPDLVIVLQGEGITLDLVGNTQITKGITYSRFETIPDAPVSSFELDLPQSKHSALSSTSFSGLCGQNLVMPTFMEAQNGAQLHQNTQIAITGCGPKISITKKKLQGNSVSVTVKTSVKGVVTITGPGLRKTTKTLGAGTHTLKVPLTANGRTARNKHHKIKIKAALKAGKKTVSKTTGLKL